MSSLPSVSEKSKLPAASKVIDSGSFELAIASPLGFSVACVVSNAEYTEGARAAARQTGVLLVDHDELSTLHERIAAT